MSNKAAGRRADGTDVKPLLFINLEEGGHHHLHVCHLVRFALRGEAHRFLLSRRLLEDACLSLQADDAALLRARTVVLEEHPLWVKASARTKKAGLRNWLFLEGLMREQDGARRLFFLYLESVFYPLALSPLPRRDVAGILFRPTFHYRREKMLGAGVKERAVFALKYLGARLLALRPGFREVFMFDPIAQEYAATRWGAGKFRLLPDPLGPEPGMARPVGNDAAIQDWSQGRRLRYLVAGALSARKGLRELADAVAMLPEMAKARMELRVVGRPDRGAEAYVETELARLRALGVPVQATLSFVSDAELDEAIAGADVVLTAYIGFKGSSGILIRAAHFGKPVLSTSNGLLGRLVSGRRLGTAVDVGTPSLFADALGRIAAHGRVPHFDPLRARAFADEADPCVFAGILGGARAAVLDADPLQLTELAVSHEGGA